MRGVGIESPSQAAAERSATTIVLDRLFGKRRHFFVDRRLQVRLSLVSLVVVIGLVVLLNLILYRNLAQDDSGLRGEPGLGTYLQAQDAAQVRLLLLGSLVFLLGYVAVSVLESHRTAGAAFNIRRRLEEVACGRYDVRVRLRHGDHLRDLERAFNDMTRSLCERTVEDIDELEALASGVEQIRDGADAREMASRLRVMAERSRKLLG